jgi:stage V sporulation protein B
MGGAAWAVYGLAAKVLSRVPEGETAAVLSRTGNALATLLAIGVAAAVYGALILALRAISRDDLALMPKGDKIAKLLRL